MSRMAHTEDILLKVTFPKMTGRRRKKATTEPFVAYCCANRTDTVVHPQHLTSRATTIPTLRELVQRLRDYPEETLVRAVGTIRETHRFRGQSWVDTFAVDES